MNLALSKINYYYKEACRGAEDTVRTIEGSILLNHECHTPCALHGMLHNAFDYEQQLHIPHNPMQPDL